MSAIVFSVVLFAAVLHASWNAIVKLGEDKFLTTVLVTSSAALFSIIALPFLVQPKEESIPFIAASAVLQIGYFALISKTYHVVDMGLAYPLMRGTAPLLVAFVGIAVLGETLPLFAWLGIGTICVGILLMTSIRTQRSNSRLYLPLCNALIIASYTLIDGIGVRLSRAPIAYTLWIFLITGVGIALWTIRFRLEGIRYYLNKNWYLGIIGGTGAIASYGLALWAMTLAPVAIVAALRETSILFAVVISGLILKENVDRLRIISSCIIALGVILLRLC